MFIQSNRSFFLAFILQGVEEETMRRHPRQYNEKFTFFYNTNLLSSDTDTLQFRHERIFFGEILNHCTPREPASLSDFNRQFVTIRRDYNSWPCHEIYYYFFYGKKSASSLFFCWIFRHMNFMHVNPSSQATAKIWSSRELHTEWMIMTGPFCIQFAKKTKYLVPIIWFYALLFGLSVCLVQFFFCFVVCFSPEWTINSIWKKQHVSEFIPCVRSTANYFFIYSDFSFVSKHFLNSLFGNVNRSWLRNVRRENETRRRKKVENLKCALQEKNKFTKKSLQKMKKTQQQKNKRIFSKGSLQR